jgi:hypothetical protein
MREANPFPKEETLTIIESRPRKARIPAIVRAVCIRPDPKDWKAKPRLDDVDAVMARLPPDTVELIDIDYNGGLSRLPSLDRQSHIRYVHLGATTALCSRSHAWNACSWFQRRSPTCQRSRAAR